MHLRDTIPHSIALRRLVAMFVCVSMLVLGGLYAAPAQAQIPRDQIETTQAEEAGMVFHHVRRYEPGVELMVDRAPELLGRVEAGLGLEEMPTIDVWVLPRVSDYFDYHQIEERPSDWAVGLSFSDQHEIIVAHGGERTSEQAMSTFAHELAHVAVDQARGGEPVPRWFNEGFAVMMAQQWDHERSERLAQAAAGDNLRSFDKLWDEFPAHQMSGALAYDQSFHFVRWLRAEYGEDLFARVNEQLGEDTSFREALESETGVGFDALEARWRESLTGSASFWSILRDDLTIFFGAALLFIVTYIVARRRRRRQLDAMPDEPDSRWDYDEARYPLPGREDDA
ncbi:MAG: peptidase MA family metallohydrolase [Persicimonas sp.]